MCILLNFRILYTILNAHRAGDTKAIRANA